MRPTELKYRSPKDRTEFNSNILINNFGEKLFHSGLVAT